MAKGWYYSKLSSMHHHHRRHLFEVYSCFSLSKVSFRKCKLCSHFHEPLQKDTRIRANECLGVVCFSPRIYVSPGTLRVILLSHDLHNAPEMFFFFVFFFFVGFIFCLHFVFLFCLLLSWRWTKPCLLTAPLTILLICMVLAPWEFAVVPEDSSPKYGVLEISACLSQCELDVRLLHDQRPHCILFPNVQLERFE
jgi:hypothetical protein